MIRIAPSILSADAARLAEEIKDVESGGADLIHIDVMDGHFVPNLTFGPMIVNALRKETRLPLDVHLMIEHADRYIPDFAGAGADMISVHAEACVHLHRTLSSIREAGKSPGVVINPATPVSFIEPILGLVDFVLLMTVNPGFGGQHFIDEVLDKIRELRSLLDRKGLQQVEIEVDGGINAATAEKVSSAGASILVAGNAVFGATDRQSAIHTLRQSAAAGYRK